MAFILHVCEKALLTVAVSRYISAYYYNMTTMDLAVGRNPTKGKESCQAFSHRWRRYRSRSCVLIWERREKHVADTMFPMWRNGIYWRHLIWCSTWENISCDWQAGRQTAIPNSLNYFSDFFWTLESFCVGPVCGAAGLEFMTQVSHGSIVPALGQQRSRPAAEKYIFAQ